MCTFIYYSCFSVQVFCLLTRLETGRYSTSYRTTHMRRMYTALAPRSYAIVRCLPVHPSASVCRTHASIASKRLYHQTINTSIDLEFFSSHSSGLCVSNSNRITVKDDVKIAYGRKTLLFLDTVTVER